MTLGGFERSSPASQALASALSFLEQSGIRHSLRSAGQWIKTTECRLEDPARGIRQVGRGKGIGDQSPASAVFEAIEHMEYERDAIDDAVIQTLDLKGRDRELARGSPDFRLVCGGRPIPLTRLPFRSLREPRDMLQFPAVLLKPGFQTANAEEARAIHTFALTRYSSNSGTASGLSADEAILHGLLELIERDAIGIELLRTVIHKNPYPVREIDPGSLPASLASVCEDAGRECEATVVVWDVTTDIAVPAMLCALRSNCADDMRMYFGSGASLSKAYAVERAILEAVQTYHTHKVYDVPLPRPHSSRLETASLYRRCYLDAGHFGYRGGSTQVDFRGIGEPVQKPDELTPAAQVDAITTILAARQWKAYARTIVDAFIHVVQVVVPGLEKFHLTSYGIPVAPSARGRDVLDSKAPC